MHVLEVLHLGKLFKVSFTWYKGRDFFSGYSSNGEKMLFCFSAELRCICVSLRYSFTLVHILCLVSGHKHRGAEVSLYTGFLGRFLKTLTWFGSQWPQKIHRQKNEGGRAGRLTLRPCMDDAILSPVNRSKGAAGCLLQKARRDGHGAGIPNQRLFTKIKRIKRSLTTVGVTDRARVRFHPARGKRQSSSTENSRRLYFIIYFFLSTISQLRLPSPEIPEIPLIRVLFPSRAHRLRIRWVLPSNAWRLSFVSDVRWGKGLQSRCCPAVSLTRDRTPAMLFLPFLKMFLTRVFPRFYTSIIPSIIHIPGPKRGPYMLDSGCVILKRLCLSFCFAISKSVALIYILYLRSSYFPQAGRLLLKTNSIV